jgi:hypothetical protein
LSIGIGRGSSIERIEVQGHRLLIPASNAPEDWEIR